MLEPVNRHIIRYNKLIDYFKEQSLSVCERHHIIPKCLGGSNKKDNIIKLSPKAHLLAHYLLCKAYPDNRRLKHAFAMMAVNNHLQNRFFFGRIYEQAKIERSKALTGVPRPEWVREKLRKPKSNKENYKHKKSETHRKNIGLALKGKKKQKTSICIYCSKLADNANIAKWHNSKCKYAT